MATTSHRSSSDTTGTMSSFSYAQAAKGISSTSASAAPTAKASSGSITPAKDATPSSNTLPTNPPVVNNVEDDTAAASLKRVQKELEKSSGKEPQANGVAPQTQPNIQQRSQISGPASPEFGGTASSSTLGKDDDVSSLANASSESTWENKSQGSAAVEKSADQGASQEEKSKKGQSKEKTQQKPLHEAPPPTVNIWKQRASEFAKPSALPQAPKKGPVSVPAVPSIPSMKASTEKTNDAIKPETRRKSKHPTGPEGTYLRSAGRREKGQNANIDARTQVDDKAGQGRRDTRTSKVPHKEDPSNVAAPLPPTRDEQSWPTVETAQDEDKKKAVSKPEKDVKDRTTTASRTHGKNEWVSMPYTPTVVFNTPLPNPGNRRGGARGGSRGGATASSRGGAYNNTSGSPEKESTGGPTPYNGDATKRERSDGASARDITPEKSRRATSAGPHYKDGKTSSGSNERSDRTFKFADAPNGYRNSAAEGVGFPSPGPTQSGQGSKQAMPNRQRASRKFESTSAEKGRDDLSSSMNDIAATQESRNAGASTSDRPEAAYRKQSTAVETSFPPAKHGSGERRNGQFGSVSGRERGEGRGRGSMRGGRGATNSFNHHGAHGFTNGHTSGMQPGQYTYPRSPSFSEGTSYFGPPPQGRSMRGGGRPQSMVMDSNYGRSANGYPQSQQLSPIQTFIPGMYDQPYMQSMSAMPYSPMMDNYQLVSMIQMQLEYYFSVENLCKDMFMRKHMDSKGFVYLTFIADFNRIKQLTTDLEMIKLVCYQSRIIEYRLGVDGKDRLRRREGWEQWVLSTSERDSTAQNDGPDELHNPPVPHPQGLENIGGMRYPPTMSPTGPSSPGWHQNEVTYQSLQDISNTPMVNGQHSRVTAENAQHAEPFSPSTAISQNDQVNTASIPPAMNPEADSFSDEQIEGLKIIVRDVPISTQPLPATGSFHTASSRTFSNGSIDLQNVSEDIHKSDHRPNGIQVNGVNAAHG
ncbi:hypothetical protein EJ05DRAFT_188156 [Pseudovirgaria hyperparasitica]|uniref:HTH La-type RNA-binding domain-containing protein n=1 Tax=Pseudovirgaria hyperparasitica TaxID=470096 RepID=A0A6A6WIM2_9PEZI|nr:uncharacterized protein EJ05DRAFT_188156 [Pseudovirgaria hyperparasitica]KAF2761886.1 hypothetical protein EJ05DRAFT_188156 [Pseudovirgaria hyperparasitica]